MKTFSDANLRRDLLKLTCLFVALSGTGALFFSTPMLAAPTLLSIVFTMILSPFVAVLERRGYPRILSITILFLIIGSLAVFGAVLAFGSLQGEWDSFRRNAPQYFQSSMSRFHEYEGYAKQRLPFLASMHPTDSLLSWGESTGTWFVTHGAAIAGSVLTYLLMVPILTFVLLNEGRAIRRRFFQLVPNRFFEQAYHVTHDISGAISDYIRAKLLEAVLVGLLTAVGLALFGAPYAWVLGIIAGVTNIIPYIGPVIGAVPGIAIVALDSQHGHLLWAVVAVYGIANLIDMLLIFPLVVAKLVNLHPLILIAVVALGQEYYGLVGMLIFVPLAAAAKVILQEIYRAVYEHREVRRSPRLPGEPPLVRHP